MTATLNTPPLLDARGLRFTRNDDPVFGPLDLHVLCGLQGRRVRQMPGNALAIVGLAGYEDTLVRHLSAGQKRRLALARIWLSPAPLWLLDEPYANLDLEGITLVNRMISAHLRAGGAALVTTHGAYAAPPVRTRQLDLGGAA